MKNFNFSQKWEDSPWIFYLLVFFLGLIPLFYNLGGPVLNLWDESRRAVNAWEMYHNGNFLVTYFNGEPEMWGTKPPLLIWLQTASMHIFGLNEWALRFPAALAGLFLGFFILWFNKYYSGSYIWGLVTVLILYTSNGFINAHSVRTGDFDAILILFTTAASLLLFLATEEIEKRKKGRFILWFFVMITLAAMTKGIAAFIMGPAYLLYLIFKKDLLNWMKNRNTWIGSGILVAVVAGYYLLRNLFNPGYLEAVINNEVTGRYLDTMEQNKAPFSYYFRLLYQLRFKNWYFLLPLGAMLGYFSKDIKIKKLLSYLILISSVYLIIISISETKLSWYSLPALPFIAMITAVFFLVLFRIIHTTDILTGSYQVKNWILIAIILFFFASPYFNIYKKNKEKYLPYQEGSLHNISFYLRDVERGTADIDQPVVIAYDGEFQQFLFYVYKLRDEGYDIDFREWRDVKPGSELIVYQDEVLRELEARYEMEEEAVGNGVYRVSF